MSSVPGADSLVLGLAGIAIASIGQHILTPGDNPNPTADIGAATRWYLPGVWLVIVGFWGTYTNVSLLRFPSRAVGAVRGWWVPRVSEFRLVLIACAVLWNLLALFTLRSDWTSGRGALLWAISLVFLVLACSRERIDVRPTEGQSESGGWNLPRGAEIGIFSLILVLAF